MTLEDEFQDYTNKQAYEAVFARRMMLRERNALDRLGLVDVAEPSPRHFLTKAVGWMGARVASTAAFAATLSLWFFFVAQIFVTEFLHYHSVIGWLNQALVHLPYFSFIPHSSAARNQLVVSLGTSRFEGSTLEPAWR